MSQAEHKNCQVGKTYYWISDFLPGFYEPPAYCQPTLLCEIRLQQIDFLHYE